VNLYPILVGAMLGMLAGALYVRYRQRRTYFAATEYWVYLPGTELPEQKAIMHRMLSDNPYGRPSDPPLGPREGVIFSDVRLHIALVLRAKNPHAFRTDLFAEDVESTAEQLDRLAQAKSLAKIRFISDQPLPDKRHITFLVHATDAVSELANGILIFDHQSDRLIEPAEFSNMLRNDPTGTGPEMHVRVVWKRTAWGGQSETRGLRKIGLDDLVSAEMERDEKVLVVEVMDEAARQLWSSGTVPEPFEVSAFDDRFLIKTQPPRNGFRPVRIMRVQAA
jgi:hypothetical protein